MREPSMEEPPKTQPSSTLAKRDSRQFLPLFFIVVVLLGFDLFCFPFAKLVIWRLGSNNSFQRDILSFIPPGIVAAQMSILWLLLRNYRLSRTTQVLAGWFFCHLIVVLLLFGASYEEERMPLLNVMGRLCVSFYLAYVVHSFLLNLLIRFFRLSGVWGDNRPSSRFSIGDLLCLTFVSAVTVSEVSLGLKDVGIELRPFFEVFLLFWLGIIFLFTLLLVLGIGTFLSDDAIRFIPWFYLLLLLGPFVVATMLTPGGFSTPLSPPYTIAITYLLTVALALPLRRTH